MRSPLCETPLAHSENLVKRDATMADTMDEDEDVLL